MLNEIPFCMAALRTCVRLMGILLPFWKIEKFRSREVLVFHVWKLYLVSTGFTFYGKLFYFTEKRLFQKTWSTFIIAILTQHI